MQVPELSDAFLVERAVRCAEPPEATAMLRWAVIKRTFGVGSTVAKDLCRRFGLNPDEVIHSPTE